jgi:cytochrome c5
MNHASTFLIVATAATLLACSKSEDPPAPTTQPTAVEAPQAEPAMEPVTPVVEPQAETVTAAPPPAPPTATSPPAAAKPTPTRPVDAAPAAKTADTSASAPDLAHGQAIYRQACAFCHDKGVAGAPKPGEKDAWTPRLAQGMDALYAAAWRGKGAMPAKGGNPSLTENDIHAAVDYLVAQSR